MDYNNHCMACFHKQKICKGSSCLLRDLFPATNPRRFDDVREVYGLDNVKKHLKKVAPEKRREAADALAMEASLRIRDPISGAAGVINRQQKMLRDYSLQVAQLSNEIFEDLRHLPSPYPIGGQAFNQPHQNPHSQYGVVNQPNPHSQYGVSEMPMKRSRVKSEETPVMNYQVKSEKY